MTTYVTSDGDMLDAICWSYYGAAPGVVETVLSANPGLADLGDVLPAGVAIKLPEIQSAPVETEVTLWT